MVYRMIEPIEAREEAVNVEEDRILRFWTPILLRTIVILAMFALIAGLVGSALLTPDKYVEHYRQVRLGHLAGAEDIIHIVSSAFAGEPRAMLMLGLYLLTLVPLVRVAFCLGLFIKIRDLPYVCFTAYVLAALIFGAMLGRIG
jgi:uncharacterized membrane protein